MDRQLPEFPLISKIKHAVGAALLVTAAALYLYGTCAPAIRIIGREPEFLDNSVQIQDYSMIGLVRLLLKQQSYVPFACTAVFSFALPIIKFTLVTMTLLVATCCRRRSYSYWLPLKTVRVLRVICKYQLVDVFSVILLVTFINFGGISVDPLPAAKAYLCYCLLSIVITQWLCHCYLDTFERTKAKYAGLLSDSFSNPLLASTSPECFVAMDDLISERCTTQWDNSDGCTELPSSKMAASSSPTSLRVRLAEEQRDSNFLGHQQDVRQRFNRGPPWPDYLPRGPLDLPSDCSEHTSEWHSEHVCNHLTDLPRAHRSHLRILWGKASLCSVKVARPFLFLFLLGRSACRAAFGILCRAGGRLRWLLGVSPTAVDEPVADEIEHLSADGRRIEHSFSRQHFVEYLGRIFFIVLLLCISIFALIVCCVRPVLEVALVPGQQRGFAIATSSRSLGDIFWRLYSMGHVISGCGILFVFPVFATFVAYITSLGTLVGIYLLERSAESYASSPTSHRRLADGSLVGSGTSSNNARRAVNATKVLSYISSSIGDVAMPDVQSIGLLTSYFIVNNVDFFGARLPATPLGEPNGTLERLLWNFSGFWAMVAFGVSASQIHRLSLPFEDVSQKVQRFLHSEGALRFPISVPPAADGCTEGRLHDKGDDVTLCSTSNSFGTQRVDDSSTVRPSDMTMVSGTTSSADSDSTVSPGYGRRRRKNSLSGVLLQGCIRVAVAVALLLPIWQEPVDVIDIDLSVVNNQLRSFVNYASPSLKKVLPQSFGDCFSLDHQPPRPCLGSLPLANFRTSTYEARARWVTGLQTTQLHVVRFDAALSSRIVLKVAGTIDTLSLSLRIGQCLYNETAGECPVVWDGTDACCDDNTTFTIQIGVECGSTFPYLSEATLLETRISRLVIREKILGLFPVELADITGVVEEHLSEWVRTYLRPQNKWIHWTDGETMSLIELLNLLLHINAPAGLECPRIQ